MDKHEIIPADLEGIALVTLAVFPGGGLDLALNVHVDFIGGPGKAGHLRGVIDLVYPGVVVHVAHECGLVTCHPQ